jgi:hypothetical protein
MGDIKLVVTIPEEDYLTFSKLSEKEKTNDLSYYERVIANGTPLKRELDKIRSEIVELTKCPYGTECLGAGCPSNTDCMLCGDHVLEIIDKYNAESED